MDRSRIVGVGRVTQRQKQGGLSTTSSPKSSRVMSGTSSYEVFADGLDSALKGASALAHTLSKEEEAAWSEEQRKTKVASVAIAKGNKEEFKATVDALRSSNDSYSSLNHEQFMEVPEYQEAFEKYFHQDEIQDEDVRFSVTEDAMSLVNTQAIEALAAIDKEQSKKAALTFIRHIGHAVAKDDNEDGIAETRVMNTALEKARDDLGLSVDEVAEVAVGEFNSLSKVQLTSPRFLNHLLDEEDLSSGMSAQVQKAISDAKVNQSVVKENLKAAIQMQIKDENFGWWSLSDEELHKLYRSNHMQVSEVYTFESVLADAQKARKTWDEEQQKQAEIGQAVVSYLDGEFFSYEGEVTREATEDALRTSLRSQLGDEGAVDLAMIERAKVNVQIPKYIEERIEFGIAPSGLTKEDDIPKGTKQAVIDVKRLDAHGMLHRLPPQAEQNARAILGLELAGYTLEESVRTVANAKASGVPVYASFSGKEMAEVTRKVEQHFNEMFDDVDAGEYILKQATNVYRAVYAQQFNLNGGQAVLAHKVTEEIVKESFVAVEGSLLPRRAFSLRDDQIRDVVKVLIEDARKRLPSGYKDEKLKLIPLSSSVFQLADERNGMIYLDGSPSGGLVDAQTINRLASKVSYKKFLATQKETKEQTEAILNEAPIAP